MRRLGLVLGDEIRAERRRRGWTLAQLADRAGIGTSTIAGLEDGRTGSLEAYVRVANALGLQPSFSLAADRVLSGRRDTDPVHAAMGEVEAQRFRSAGRDVRLDEPYQHFQFAGRADVVAIDLAMQALLHIENRTRFPDIQAFAGAYNAKRAYLADALAKRLAVRGGFRNVTHVVVALWSAEVLHTVRLRGHSFAAVCPDDASRFARWWDGTAPAEPGDTSTLVLFDPLPGVRRTRRRWVGLAGLAGVEPRYRGYEEALSALRKAALA